MPMSESAPRMAVVTSDCFADHALPAGLADRLGGHPERPDRIRAVNAALDAMTGLLRLSPGDGASDEALRLVHPQSYIDHVAASAGAYADEGETYVGLESDAIARLAVSAGIVAADAVMAGACRRAFAAVRPPGHHALVDRAMGFCLYANIAIVARHLQKQHGLDRIAIVDFDVHHGNGTQAVFYDDPTVLTVSLHEDPRTLWPGSGFATETGEGAGLGFCVNIPIPAGTGDAEYLRIFREKALPRVRAFEPQVLLVSAGFDAAAVDPLAHLELTNDGFAAIGHDLAALADELCDGRLIAMLEGGYDLRALADGVTAFVDALR